MPPIRQGGSGGTVGRGLIVAHHHGYTVTTVNQSMRLTWTTSTGHGVREPNGTQRETDVAIAARRRWVPGLSAERLILPGNPGTW